MNKLNLKPEVKCEFYVDEQRKKVWQIELDMLEKVIEICNKYNISYFMAGGSLLGTVRHKGFIPWDDDIDIVMKRDEYNKFVEVAEKELKAPFFLQYYKTEKNYIRGHAQIRNSNTTAIINGDQRENYNKGIFIDIFPLDNVPDNKIKRKIFVTGLDLHKKILVSFLYKNDSNIVTKILFRTFWKFFSIEKEIVKYEKNIQKYNRYSTQNCATIGVVPKDIIYKNEWLEETIELDFEYMKVKCMREYDKWLTRQYGNYMEIPKNKNGSSHGKVFFDVEKSYLNYSDKIEEITKNL